MNFKKIFTLALSFALALALFACGGKNPLEIADENGEEDCSLAVLTVSDICAKEPRYSCRIYGIVRMDENRSFSEEQSVYDADKMVGHAQAEFSGVTVLQKTYGITERITFEVTCERTKGNMRVVLVDGNMNIIHDFSLGESSAFTLENAKGKTYEIRIACESAEFNVTAERTFG
jgi:hypothetical protein